MGVQFVDALGQLFHLRPIFDGVVAEFGLVAEPPDEDGWMISVRQYGLFDGLPLFHNHGGVIPVESISDMSEPEPHRDAEIAVPCCIE